jgi:hypothetical protein
MNSTRRDILIEHEVMLIDQAEMKQGHEAELSACPDESRTIMQGRHKKESFRLLLGDRSSLRNLQASFKDQAVSFEKQREQVKRLPTDELMKRFSQWNADRRQEVARQPQSHSNDRW